VEDLAADPARRDELLLHAQRAAPVDVGRIRALPEAPLHHHRVGLRVGARDAPEPRPDLEARRHRIGRRVRVRRGCDAARAAELLRTRNCHYGASSPSPRELAGRHEIGIERILWGSDYPHYEGTFPNSRKAIRHTFHDKPEPEVRAILGENAARLYGFDLTKLRPWADKHGPTPDEVAVPLTPEEFPKNVHTGAFM
jgi:hypothetical protein